MSIPPAPSPQTESAEASAAARWKSDRGAETAPKTQPGATRPADAASPPATQNSDGPSGGGSAEARRWLRDDCVPAWLVSLILHLALVLLLAMLSIAAAGGGNELTLTVGSSDTRSNAPLLRIDAAEPAIEPSDDSSAAPQPLDAAVSLERAAVTAPASAAPVSSGPRLDPFADLGHESPLSLAMSLSGGRLGDRSGRGRSAAVAAGDATAESEAAIEGALEWLAAHQHRDGGWSFRLDDPHGPCDGKCANPLKNPDDAPTPRTAATGLALLAFLGGGHTQRSGEYAETVQRGIYYLRGQARETSFGIDLQNGSMYGHGIATLALSEAFVLTGDEDLRELVEGTTMFCASAQHTQGGWGYVPGGPADITLTAWQIVAIKTAEQQKIWSPSEVIPSAKAFVQTLANESRNRFGYKSPEPQLSTTAMGLLLQLYFGHRPGETGMAEGLDWISAEGPSPTDVYYDYYAMLALHHSRHRGRMDFARVLREHLVATQARGGHEKGSWNFPDRYGSVGGRLYTTALCTLILQTPYRYVPMSEADKPFKL